MNQAQFYVGNDAGQRRLREPYWNTFKGRAGGDPRHPSSRRPPRASGQERLGQLQDGGGGIAPTTKEAAIARGGTCR